MAGVKISALPPIVTPALTDVSPWVQSGVTYQVSNSQLVSLFNSNIQIAESQVTNLVTDLAAKLDLSGGTMIGSLILNADPTAALGAVTKQYADNIAAGLNPIPGVVAASTTALTVTYANGVAGVGATLTNAGAQTTFALDGQSPTVGQRVLIKDQAAGLQNGIYTVTSVGSGATNWVLTRATDYDSPSEIEPGDLIAVEAGTVNGGSSWIQTATIVAVGTTALTFSVFFNPASFLQVANNLSDVNNAGKSLGNLTKYTTTATAAGTTTLTATDTFYQYFTGATTQTVVLPVTSTLTQGRSFYIVNLSSGVVTVQSSGANTIQAMAANTTLLVTCILTSGTGTASWNAVYGSTTLPLPVALGGTGVTVSDPIIQRVSTQTGTSATGTTVIPFDNTIPQITEGDQYMTLSITPKNSANILVIESEAFSSSDATSWQTMALFQDSTANALAATSFLQGVSNQGAKQSIKYQMTAGTTSATTFRIRMGNAAANTTTFNGVSSGQFLGGVMNSYIRITEYAS